jgi:hypothetical protein
MKTTSSVLISCYNAKD